MNNYVLYIKIWSKWLFIENFNPSVDNDMQAAWARLWKCLFQKTFVTAKYFTNNIEPFKISFTNKLTSLNYCLNLTGNFAWIKESEAEFLKIYLTLHPIMYIEVRRLGVNQRETLLSKFEKNMIQDSNNVLFSWRLLANLSMTSCDGDGWLRATLSFPMMDLAICL